MTEQQNEQQNTNVHPDQPKKKSWLLVISIIMIALAVGGYFGLRFMTDKINASEEKTAKFSVEVKQLQEKLDQMQNVVQGLQSEIQKSNLARSRNWNPIVIEHLIRIADLTLNTTGETKLAISFLSAAKQYASSPELSAINHALNKDIASLQVVPAVDSSELILKIEALNQKVDALPIMAQQLDNLQKTKSEEDSSAKNLWKKFFASAVKSLKDIVVIRRQIVEPLLLPEQETILRLSIQNKLSQAEYAVMQRQNKLYQSCLEQVVSLITRHFIASSAVTTDVLSGLKELRQIDLQPKLPLLTESIAAVINFMSANKMPNGQEARPQIQGAKSS